MASVYLVFNRRNKLNKKKEGPIELCITIDGTPSYIGLKKSVLPKLWDKKKKEVKANHQNWFEINTYFNNQLEKVNNYFSVCESKELTPKIEEIRIVLDEKKKLKKGFISFCREEIGRRNDLGNATIHHQLNKLDVIEDWANGDITFNKIDLALIEDFDNHLANVRKIKQNTRAKYHALLKSYIRRAVNNKLMKFDDNPYNSFKIKTEETQREHLLEGELNLWEKFNIEGKEHFESIIDKFLFSCYTGLRFSDYQNIEKSNFDIVSEDEIYLTFKMLKVKTSIYRMPLHKLFNGKALALVLKYYNREYSNGKLFPTHTEGYYNRALKTIGKVLEVDKKLSSHVGRHTFGTLLATKTNDPMLIKSLMGHKNIDTSMIYINITNKGIEDKLNKIDW